MIDVPGEIIFFQIGPGPVLGPYDAGAFSGDLGRSPRSHDLGSITLSRNVDDDAAVDSTFAATLEVGATRIKTTGSASIGGHRTHFADPNDVIWKICHNPGWSVDDDGTVQLS